MEGFAQLYKEIAQLGLPGGMALFIFALYKKWIVWGSDCIEKVKIQSDLKDQYKAIADKRTSELEARVARVEEVAK